MLCTLHTCDITSTHTIKHNDDRIYSRENINCFKCYEPKLHHENILMVKQNVMKIKKIAKRKKYIE